MFKSDLVLSADIRRVGHVVAPVLLLDLLLLFIQEHQLLLAAMHVLVQAVQVMTAPLGVVLRLKRSKTNMRGSEHADFVIYNKLNLRIIILDIYMSVKILNHQSG